MAKNPTDRPDKALQRGREKTAPASNESEIDAFLQKVRSTPPADKTPGVRGRLIFGMDATASREPTWDRACQIQGEMFTATAELGGAL